LQGTGDAVTREHLVPNERLARVICKLLGQNPCLDIDALRERSAPPWSGSYTQRRREYRRAAASADFDQSLASAISQGWLSKGEAGLVLTGKGKEIAARTRAGMHRSRWNDTGLDATLFAVRRSRLAER
jgi:hypothetical protein